MSRKARTLLEGMLRESEEISHQIRTLDNLRARLQGFTSNLSPDTQRSAYQPHNDRIGAYTARIIDLEEELEARVLKYSQRRQLITESLLKMRDDRHGELLHMRYIEGEPWKDVAAELGISVTWAYTLHNRALKEFENLFYN